MWGARRWERRGGEGGGNASRSTFSRTKQGRWSISRDVEAEARPGLVNLEP